jgi:hypothetical protein
LSEFCNLFVYLFIYLFHLPSDPYRYGSSHRIHKSTRKCAEHLSQHNLQGGGDLDIN